jgi:hypothetical protein
VNEAMTARETPDLREALVKAMPNIAGAMPWYDEATPDYTEAIDAILTALATPEPAPAVLDVAERKLRALLLTAFDAAEHRPDVRTLVRGAITRLAALPDAPALRPEWGEEQKPSGLYVRDGNEAHWKETPQ